MRSFHIVPRVAAASATQKASHDCVLPGLPGGSEAWTAAQLRIMHDLASIDLPPALATCVPVEGTAMYEQRVTITIPRGEGAVYGGGRFTFGLKFKPAYPFEAPRVTCLSRTFHPNINAAGSVCLNILRLDWSPILTIQSVILGLILLLSEPDGEEPLNHGMCIPLCPRAC